MNVARRLLDARGVPVYDIHTYSPINNKKARYSGSLQYPTVYSFVFIASSLRYL